MNLSGNVWKLGDDVGATDLVSPKYDKMGMRLEWEECAKHVLEESNPAFSSTVRRGDILVAGRNFGAGHAHYYMTAIMACHTCGLSALLAESVGALFLRAAIDAGVPALPFVGLSELVNSGDRLEFNLETGLARNMTTGRVKQFNPVSPIILDILTAGGSKNWALRRVGANHAIH
jgi:3-isopropylmalate/(R)-2-methylmalate dehydratase small subunit